MRVCVCVGGVQVKLVFVLINNIASSESVVHSDRMRLGVDKRANMEIAQAS